MKVRNLIPDDLFDEANIDKILQDTSSQESTYYKAILQNLFFATLNTKQEERKFRTETRGHKGYNPDFGNQNVFRYHDLFRDSESLKTLFDKIPFLNGGLFECLDYKPKGEDKDERKYIDGFTATKGKQPVVPNFLFFSEVQKKDISKFYGKKNKEYEVEGLINLLKNYNFTIDENEADDIEVALDPELLGSIFENLLASYNPETATTARKATGSFYTPREIVNYMTNESLKQYFITHLKNDTSTQTELEVKLDSLIKSNNFENPFDERTSKQITKLIDDLRVVDPAVGSGAFPMAVLNKLVFILSKIDPDNTFWKKSQINGVKKAVNDPIMQRKLIEQIEKQFKEKNADYGRKLYLIEKCIYGVDIQQIAVEIAKLRFFISLLVDEKIEWDKPEKQSEDSLFDMDNENTELINKFEELKNEYQNESEKERKDELREEIEKSIYKIVEDKIIPQIRRIEEKYSLLPNAKQREEAITTEKQKLAKRLGYDIEQIEKDLKAFTEGRKPKEFFLWNIYFAEVFSHKKGFDIVIGNPPYINVENLDNNIKKYLFKNYKTCKGRTDIYIAFIEATMKMLTLNGGFSYIIPYPFTNQNYGCLSRKMLIENYFVREILDTSKYFVFETANVKNVILNVVKCKNRERTVIKIAKSKNNFTDNSFKVNYLNQNLFAELNNTRFETKDISQALKLKSLIWKNSIRLDEICLIAYGARLNHKTKNLGKKNYIHQTFKNGYKPFTEGKNIDRYSYTQYGWLDYKPKEHYNPMFPDLFENEKIFFINVVKDRLRFAFDKEKYYNSHTVINCVKWNLLKNVTHITVKRHLTKDNIVISSKYNYKFLLGLLNSNIINWYF